MLRGGFFNDCVYCDTTRMTQLKGVKDEVAWKRQVIRDSVQEHSYSGLVEAERILDF